MVFNHQTRRYGNALYCFRQSRSGKCQEHFTARHLVFRTDAGIQKFADRDKQEVKGYYELLENIFNSWERLKFNESSIKHFHKELLKYSDKDRGHLGDYKFGENKVVAYDNAGKEVGVIFNPTLPHLTPKEMSELVESTNASLTEKKYHPLLIVANFLVEFLAIHPFQDGNGRISRVLTNLLLLQNGYLYMPYVSHEKLVEDNKTDYYLALRATQKHHKTDHEDISPWLNFLLDSLLIQVTKAKEIMNSEQPEKRLSERQGQIFAVFTNDETLGVAEIDKRLKGSVPQVTIKQALARLVALRLIERMGQGRGVRYVKHNK